MTAWFEDFPLDRTREDTRKAEALLIATYSNGFEAVALYENAGLSATSISTNLPVRFLWKEMLDKARNANRLSLLIVEVLNDPEAKAIHAELAQLHAGYEAIIETAAVLKRPSLATLSLLPPSAQVVIPGGIPNALAQQGQLEQTINAIAGFSDLVAFRTALTTAEVRTARVEVGGKAAGTGFLIGKDLLLTNWHVVSDVNDNAQALFDYKTLPNGETSSKGRAVDFADQWLVAKSPHDDVAVELGAEGPPAGTLDFALVRLKESVSSQPIGPDPLVATGDNRGHYSLSDVVYAFDDQEPILIVGHPDGRPMQLSYASPSGVKYTTHSSRVRYQTNTEGGSSGSPVFNKEWKVVALHHAAGPTQATGDFNLQTNNFNQGIPIASIIEFLKTELDAADLQKLGI